MPPPAGFSIPNERAIIDRIDTIDSKLLNFKKDHLAYTQMLVVAGTADKAYALGALLRDDAYPVSYLCTDVEAVLMN